MRTNWILSALEKAIWCAVGVFAGLAIADISTSESGLFGWQTLVTGVLAVGAAALTIGQMERTEGRAQVRHDQLVRLTLRSDRLRVLRAQHSSSTIRTWAVILSDVVSSLSPSFSQKGQYDRMQTLVKLNEVRITLHKVTMADAVIQAKDLFDPELAELFEFLKREGGSVPSQMASGANEYLLGDSDDPDDLESVLLTSEEIAEFSRDFADHLDSLAAEYR